LFKQLKEKIPEPPKSLSECKEKWNELKAKPSKPTQTIEEWLKSPEAHKWEVLSNF
jgi:hypothetical protein